MRWLVLSILLSGCYVGPVFALKTPTNRSCDVDFHSWGGGLTYDVLQGRGDGEFDYDPYGPHKTRTYGTYELDSGDFWWVTEYSADSDRTQDYVLGYGTLWRTGDLDIGYEQAITFQDEQVHRQEVRTIRAGCEEVTRIERRDGSIIILSGEYVPGGFVYERQYLWNGMVATHQGALQKDQSWVETADLSNGPLRLQLTEEGDATGEVSREFSTNDGSMDLRGSWVRYRDGWQRMEYTSKAAGGAEQRWAYEVNAAGAGEGTWSQGNQSCDLRIEAFKCTREACNSGAGGSCQFPLPWPERY